MDLNPLDAQRADLLSDRKHTDDDAASYALILTVVGKAIQSDGAIDDRRDGGRATSRPVSREKQRGTATVAHVRSKTTDGDQSMGASLPPPSVCKPTSGLETFTRLCTECLLSHSMRQETS